VNICTIIARNYLAQARVLARSFKEVHPDGNCTVLVIDDPAGYIDPAAEQFELLTIHDIALPDAERMAAFYDVMELSTAVKPWLLRTLLARPGVDSVSYFDPDIQVFASLVKIEEEAIEHGIVLTPHFTAPLPRDGRSPSEEDILIAGTYNLGFIGLGAGDAAEALLDWWSERLENECLNDPANGHFVDQRWIDLAPGFWPDLFLLRETTYNIAYWNLPTRTLETDGDGYKVDGEPLRFFHFSGYDPRRPRELSKHQNRIRLGADPALQRICDAYGERLKESGYEEAAKWPYGWDTTASGLKIDRIARALFREGVETGRFRDSLFEETGAGEFRDYLTETVEGGGAASVTRYAAALWEERSDLREAYPDISGEGAVVFVSWLREFGVETGVSPELLTVDANPNGASPAGAPAEGAAPDLPAGPGELPSGVNVVGYVNSERGVGEAARQVLRALESREIAAAEIDTPAEPDQIPKALGRIAAADHPYDYNLICVNADMLPAVAAALGPRFFSGRRTAGLWFWEVSKFPEMWMRSFDDLDEVWVASEYIAEALRPLTAKPVRTIRVPVTAGPAAEMTRAELGMPEGYCFLFVFDYRSVFRRKNPLGLVQAFRKAFERGEGPSLVLKSVCSDQFPAERAQLAAAVADRPEIHLVEETISAAAKNAMIANCDSYVSLHRSEGLGLTMAEAMYFGRPVIATGYSGNLDFMTAQNSYLVPQTAARIGADAEPYPTDGEWAEPDLDHAAAVMRAVVADPEKAAVRARRGAIDIRHTHSPQAAAASIEAAIAQGRADALIARLRAPESQGDQHLHHLIELGGPPVDPNSKQMRDQAKRAYLRLLRPYIAYQSQVNVSATQALDELTYELREQLVSALGLDQELQAKLADLEARIVAQDAALQQLTERQERADDLVSAAAAEPFMADDRLTRREHPVLGRTLGFRADETPAVGGEDDAAGYRDFEDLFRGSEDMIRDRQKVYLDVIGDREPVFDAGCGRGEFLDLLNGAGTAFVGVDLDPTMVERCRQKGYDTVELGDAVEVLERTERGSLGAIFSAQVVEHMPFETLQRFLELGLSRLKPGGLMIAETVNPHSARALKAFWVDPTHQHPLFPEVLLLLCETIGYASGDVMAPNGEGDWEADRVREGEYAVIAAAPEAKPAKPAGKAKKTA
jgi:2-polyprenyl-3-methyl-5-hydroxy-6-metoxy-1,4-benzoquinol methylase/glycosyltransferase involved in cell wall biosynthesis